MSLRSLKLFIHKLTHWEYWPYQVVYAPISLLWIYYAIRARSLFFFNAANPSIRNGGFVMESKRNIYNLIPQQFYAQTTYILQNTSFADLKGILKDSGLQYPVIAKPDIGLRGNAVKKIHSESELHEYNKRAGFDYLIQEFIDLPKEIGVFYVRYPGEDRGKITGIVYKEFLTVTGNGISSTRELLNQTPRFQFQLKALQREYGDQLDRVLEKGKRLTLVPYGSHARGARFTDCSHMANDALTEVINNICTQVKGFYYGRLDLMYNTAEELENGENFMVVEINGAMSEPTHIYDPGHSLWFAWKEVARHITYMYEISRVNHHNKGIPYLNHKSGFRELYAHHVQNRKIAGF
ncbi:D-alanine--D-alanine ligase [Sinomicrobium weinanense]|uniref:D-alanine--D-alanine ligase n=1 Tax=Sinomicrobium weinanense TaxID=2842200 RepID=A0A926JUH1_9FLAO|nr:D-alanine--D-alanine ligase [Sinomicrobium weinanense]MBC9797549.1 D-alanine--D-alanine ligase [Sinomicrobium weinanense]MBU3123904.1 D-alanine--D-alanine ligase [Sinomicrobium weinanense]